MSANTIHSTDVDVGVPPVLFRENQSFKVHFHEFQSLDSKKGQYVESPQFHCFNRNWCVQFYPGGDDRAETRDGMTSICLYCESPDCGEISVFFKFLVIKTGTVAKTALANGETFMWGEFSPSKNLGWERNNFMKRSDLVKPDILNQGTLTIEVSMELDGAKPGINFVPKSQFSKQMSKLFLDEESADVLFELSGVETSAKVQYHAHRLVLSACAPELARLCEGTDKSTPVPIPDVDPYVFLRLLHFIYGGDISPDWATYAKQFIDAADKYGVTDLKVEAEAWHVSCCAFTVENVIEELLYADAKKCPLLREAAMDFVLKNAKEVIKSDSFQNVLATKDITVEIMLAMASTEGVNDSTDEEDNSRSINDLRMALYEKGLDIDGPRELLTARLKK